MFCEQPAETVLAPQASTRAEPDAPEPEPVVRLRFRSGPAAVRQVLDSLFGSPGVLRLGADDRDHAEIVLAEALNNIVEHAYAGGPGSIALQVARTGRVLAVTLCDEGQEMPGLKLPEGTIDLSGPSDALPEGGFGWHMIRLLSRNLAYCRDSGRNWLSFSLPLQQSCDPEVDCGSVERFAPEMP